VTHLSVLTQIHSPQQWNFSDIYKGCNDPQFEQDLTALQQNAAEFQYNYRGRVNQLMPEEIARCLQQLEAFAEKYSYLETFANLVFCADSRSTEAKQFFNDTKLALTRIQNQLLFFNLELQDLDTKKFDELQTSPALLNYNHYLNRIAQFRVHVLPEEAERTRNRDSLTGRLAFLQMYSIHQSEQDYKAVTTSDGRMVETQAELEALLFDSDERVRYDAYCSLQQEREQHNVMYGFILNAICQDHCIESQMRGYPSTFHKQLLASEVPESVFHVVMDGISDSEALLRTALRASKPRSVSHRSADRTNLFQRYYQLKGKSLEQNIRTCDLHAPWISDDELHRVDYKTGVQMLLEALNKFDVFYANRAADLFSNKWVDAKIRAGKGSGIFCFPTYAKHSYLSLSYADDFNSLLNLAHHVGQGVHFGRACDRQTYFNSKPPLLLAEVAASFNKLLLFDYLLKDAADDEHRRQALLTRLLEDHLNLLFYQSTISRLELILHERAARGSFDHHFVNEQWMKVYRELCGDAVEVLPKDQYNWAGMSEIYANPFSAFQYAAAHIVSLACYQQYQETGKDFIPNYLDLLASGGSINQIDALRQYVGVNLEDPTTITAALVYIEDLIEQVQATL
jgi:oligoendopeptidase F